MFVVAVVLGSVLAGTGAFAQNVSSTTNASTSIGTSGSSTAPGLPNTGGGYGY